MGMFVSINSVNLLMVLAITFLASSSAFVGHMGPRRNYRLTCLGAGEGFGSKKEPANEFPSIDAFAKDKEILLRDRSYQATAIPSLDEIQNNGKGQFGEDREKKFDFNDLTFPCEFTLKVIGLDENGFLDDVLAISKSVSEQSTPLKHATRKGNKGNYLSVTVTPVFTGGEQIYALYEKLHGDPRVKFVL